MPSIYALKPAFQNLLRPLARRLARVGITANHITVLACVLSIVTGLRLAAPGVAPRWFLILPGFFFVRMAMNALDGMLAREFGQKSDLGAYLNELTDVVSDAFLYLPFAVLAPFDPLWIGVLIWLSALSEMAGAVGLAIGVSRRYDGPMGKSDRAVVFGALAAWIGFGGTVAPWATWLFPRLLAVLLAATVFQRVAHGLAEKKSLQGE